MREIKFRVWDKWRNLFLDSAYQLSFTGEIGYSHDDDFEACGLQDQYIVQQYTGLKDKNRKDVYEGDVLSFSNEFYDPSEGESPVFLAAIRYSQEYLTWEIYDNEIGEIEHLWEYLDKQGFIEGEVIGNIYENSELLED